MQKDKTNRDISDDQIRVIGSNRPKRVSTTRKNAWKWILCFAFLAALVLIIFLIPKKEDFLTENLQEDNQVQQGQWFGNQNEADGDKQDKEQAYIEIQDTIINDIPLRIYIPHQATMSLHLGKLNVNDPDIIYATRAADIRADNGGIVGAFVLKGKPLARGLSKKGYCACIEGEISIGMAESTALFEQATEKDGDFFRQYPLVSNGQPIDNEPKGKSIRRAFCDRYGEFFMIESLSRESFHDFAQALADLQVDQAIYLPGSNEYGWAVDKQGTKHEFGEDHYYRNGGEIPKNITYLVWKKH